MFRAFSTRKSSLGYDRVGEESGSGDADVLAEPRMLTRARSVPARILLGFSKKPTEKPSSPAPPNSAQKGKNKKSNHPPLFSIFEGRWRKKKMTAKPEFARYMDYLKEGGRWDKETDTPVIHYSK